MAATGCLHQVGVILWDVPSDRKRILPAVNCFNELLQEQVLSSWGIVPYLVQELASSKPSHIVLPGSQSYKRTHFANTLCLVSFCARTRGAMTCWLRVRCESAAAAGVMALAASSLLQFRGLTAASFFLDEAADWGAEMTAAIGFVMPGPKCCHASASDFVSALVREPVV